ncbi:MAG: c-type cytochrome [Deltaproteobacteria bacterium]
MIKKITGRSLILYLLAISLTVLVQSSCTYDNMEDLMKDDMVCDTLSVSFSKDLAPLFAANCNSCHSGSSAAEGLKTDSYAAVKAEFTRILGSVEHKSGYSKMPQGGSKLSDCNIAKLKRWNTLGKPDN